MLSPITLNNYGGTCHRVTPALVKLFTESENPPRPAARAIRSLKAEEAFGDGAHRPFLHLVDGGVSDNVGMRAVLDSLEVLAEDPTVKSIGPAALQAITHRQVTGSNVLNGMATPLGINGVRPNFNQRAMNVRAQLTAALATGEPPELTLAVMEALWPRV